MLAQVDSNPIAPDALWWPEMNFNQFRWDGTIGRYELHLPRAVFVERLARAYAQCVRDLKEDDRLVPAQDPSPLRDAGYPSLDEVLDDAQATFELIRVYVYTDVFEAFLPDAQAATARFMINSVDEATSTGELIVIRGRGYHGGPGFALSGGSAAG